MVPNATPDTRPAARRSGVRAGSSWRLPVTLIALSLIPVIFGFVRLVEIAGGPQVMPENPRIDASPAPVVFHVVGAAFYAFLGAFQFSARLRRRRPGWHRKAGRLLVVAGSMVALSGLWMTLFYSGAPGGALLWAVRITVSSSMFLFIVLGFRAIRRRNISAHRAWMIRAYTLALGAGTQIFTQGIGDAALGDGDLSRALSISSAWVINAAVAEWAVRRHA